MKSDERVVHFFDLAISTNKQRAAPPNSIDVFGKLKESIGSKSAVLEINAGQSVLDLADIKFDISKNTVSLYIRHTDKKAADVYFADTVAGTSRIERKKDAEGRGFGAHFSVSLKPETGAAQRYRVVLERVPGVNSSLIIRLLQHILREMYREDENLFTCDDISGARDRRGNAKKVGFRPMLALNGLPSDQFIADLEAGYLKDITLFEAIPSRQFGGRGWLTEQQRTVNLAVRSGAPGTGCLWNELLSLFSQQAQIGFSRARIRFKRQDGQADAIDIDAATGDLLDQRYVKSKKIANIVPPLDECADRSVPHFVALIDQEVVASRT